MIDEKKVEDVIEILKRILPSVNERGQWMTHITDEKDIERLTALFFALRVLETYLATAKEMPKKRTCLLHSNNSGEKCDCCKNCIEDNKIIDECSIVTTRLLAEKYEIISCLKSDLCEIGKSLSCNEADEFGLEDILSAISEKDIEIVSCHKEIERLKKELKNGDERP